MTVRQIYEALLVELNKVEAPSLLLEDFNYFLNKIIYAYANKKYNVYEINQQATDDLRVLNRTINLEPDYINGVYVTELPIDYFHILNCVVEFTSKTTSNCNPSASKYKIGARKLTADMYPGILNNAFTKPSNKRVYFYIHNGSEDSKPNQRIEIRCGDNSKWELTSIDIDYLKTPKYITLSSSEIDELEDNSTIMEFQEYVCYELIKELTMIVLENASDSRLQSNPVVNQSIPTAGRK